MRGGCLTVNKSPQTLLEIKLKMCTREAKQVSTVNAFAAKLLVIQYISTDVVSYDDRHVLQKELLTDSDFTDAEDAITFFLPLSHFLGLLVNS